jgi:hypothetical protein
MCYNIA